LYKERQAGKRRGCSKVGQRIPQKMKKEGLIREEDTESGKVGGGRGECLGPIKTWPKKQGKKARQWGEAGNVGETGPMSPWEETGRESK